MINIIYFCVLYIEKYTCVCCRQVGRPGLSPASLSSSHLRYPHPSAQKHWYDCCIDILHLCSASAPLPYAEKAFTRLLGDKYLAIIHGLILLKLFATCNTVGYHLLFVTELTHY